MPVKETPGERLQKSSQLYERQMGSVWTDNAGYRHGAEGVRGSERETVRDTIGKRRPRLVREPQGSGRWGGTGCGLPCLTAAPLRPVCRAESAGPATGAGLGV